MTYQETLDYLYYKLPFFQKDGAKAFTPKLEKIQLLCDSLDNPEKQIKFIHIAGTNGKGSTSHMLASVFMKHGFKTGLYTSPHLKSFTERIKVDASEIEEATVIEFVELIKPQIEKLSPSFFEVTVAMAFWYFNKQKVDYAIIEVGLGGRLDSTNIITPILSVITNISLDHEQYLGNTLEKIAFEKAGIIKSTIPVVIGEVQDETFPVFDRVALSQKSKIYYKDKLPKILSQIKTQSYQDKNFYTVLKILCSLSDNYSELKWNEQKIISSLENFNTIAGLKGRWQKLKSKPNIYCDTGHNVAGVKELIKLLEKESYDTLHIIWGMVAEKDVSTILKLLPKKANYYFCHTDNARLLTATELQKQALLYSLIGEKFNTVPSAIESAQKVAQKNDLIFIGGSTFVVAEIPFL